MRADCFEVGSLAIEVSYFGGSAHKTLTVIEGRLVEGILVARASSMHSGEELVAITMALRAVGFTGAIVVPAERGKTVSIARAQS